MLAFSMLNFKIQIWLLKFQNGQLKCQNGQKSAYIGNSGVLKATQFYWRFLTKKNASIKAFMKLTPNGSWWIFLLKLKCWKAF